MSREETIPRYMSARAAVEACALEAGEVFKAPISREDRDDPHTAIVSLLELIRGADLMRQQAMEIKDRAERQVGAKLREINRELRAIERGRRARA